MKVKTSVRAGGISHNHARALKVIGTCPQCSSSTLRNSFTAGRVTYCSGKCARIGQEALKVRTKVKAAGLAVTNHVSSVLGFVSAGLPASPIEDELATAALAQLLPARLNSPLVPLIRCANRTKACEPCNACAYCKAHDFGMNWWER